MSNLPGYVGAITIVGTGAMLAATSAVLYKGSRESGASPVASTTTAAAAAALFAVWGVASAIFAYHGGYHTQLGKQPPWLPIEAVGSVAVLLLMTRIPAVSRALSGRNSVRLLSWPHLFRVEGIALLLAMLYGHLPALFAIPAGLGDIAIGFAEPFVSRRIVSGQGHRAAKWFNILGLVDLVDAMVLGGLTSYGIVHVSPVHSSLAMFPIALVPTVGVPLLLAIHILTLRQLRVPSTDDLALPRSIRVEVA